MLTVDLAEAKYILRKTLITEGVDLILDHLWIWEGERWKELVFALLTKVVKISEEEIRNLVNDLEELELLDITSLAKICKDNASLDLDDAHAQHVLGLLKEKDLSDADARKALTIMCEAALGLKENYDGKVQRYLRHYGELMLRDISKSFPFTALDQTEVKQAFTYWLQNVMNMPLSFTDENVVQFCQENNLTVEELFAAADELDMNFALVDDIIERHEKAQKEKIARSNKN